MVVLDSQEDHRNERSPKFDGPKIAEPIAYTDRWHHIWLVQLSLDQSIRRISTPKVGWTSDVGSLSLLLELPGKTEVPALAVRRPTPESDDARQNGMLVVLRDDVRRHTARNNALAIWKWRDYPLGLDIKFSILSALERQASKASLNTLLTLTKMDARELIAAVCRLRVEGLLHFDLGEVLSLETQVVSVGGGGEQRWRR